jgi:four helix bundle protein
MERKPAKSFQDLIVWQKSHKLTLSIYLYSEGFPKKEIYGLISQIRRATVSVSANIAEGFRKQGFHDKARFMNIAQGSLEECRYYLILANDLGYGNSNDILNRLEEVSKLLDAYCKTIRDSQ